jgi:hypothetical protein
VTFFHHSGRAGQPPAKPTQLAPVAAPVPAVVDDGAEPKLIHVIEGEYDMDAQPEVYRCGAVLGVRGSTWMMSPKSRKDDFAADFTKSFYQAARDYGSYPPSAAQPLVHDSGLAERRANPDRHSPIIYINGESDAFKFAEWFVGEGFEYYIHCDMAKNRDAAGVAMSHYDHVNDKVVVDMMLTLRAPTGGELRLSRFRQLIFELTNMGFSIGKVTFDQWQSLETQQELRMKGYVVEQYSVDRTTEAYDTLVELMLGSRLDYYHNAVFIKEFHELSLIDGKKVDHPEGGSKDLTDAVAATTVHALELAKVRRQMLPGVVKMGMGSNNDNRAPGQPFIGGMTREGQGIKGLPQQRILAI